MSGSLTIQRTWEVDGVMTDPTSVTLIDDTGTFGLKRIDTGEVLVAAGTAFTKIATGHYQYEATGLVAGVTYLAATRVVYLGRSIYFETTHVASDEGALVTSAEVLLNLLGTATATAEEEAVVNHCIIRAAGAIRRHLGYDPVKRERTEYHPQQSFQSQISRGIWEVMEHRATLRQVSESATNELQLQHLPVRGDPLVVVRRDYDGRSESRTGSFPASSQLTIGQDFWPNYDCLDASGVKVCRDGILRTIGLWPTTAGTVKVTYTAGYSSDELRGSDPQVNGVPIWEACISEAARRARRLLTMKKSGRLGHLAGLLTSEGLGSYNYSMDSASANLLFGSDLMQDTIDKLEPYINYGFAYGS